MSFRGGIWSTKENLSSKAFEANAQSAKEGTAKMVPLLQAIPTICKSYARIIPEMFE